APVVAAAGYRVLDEEWRSTVQPLVEATLVDLVGFDDLVDRLADLEPADANAPTTPLQSPAAVEAALALLADRFDEIHPSTLRELAIFPTRDGGLRPPSELVVDDHIVDLFAEETSAHKRVQGRLLAEEAKGWANRLRSSLDLGARAGRVLEELSAPDVEAIGAHPHLCDEQRRQALYGWLVRNESAIFDDDKMRRRLSEAEVFPTAGGQLLAAPDLVVDTDLPELGIDWRPAPEIPDATLELLARRLGIGSPEIRDLVDSHLKPAHRRAKAAGDVERSATILSYLARRIGGWSGSEIRDLLAGDAPIRLADRSGAFQLPEDVLLPTGDLAHHVDELWDETAKLSTSYPDETHPFLRKLGVPELPSLEMLHRAAAESVEDRADSEAIAVLLAEHRRRSLETETLVGDFAERYADEHVVRHLDDDLAAQLGFGEADDVGLEEVVRQLDQCADSGTPVRFAVYQWLEAGLQAGDIDADELGERLEEIDWVFTDDESYFHHSEVLGERALEMFGDRRGYWSRGVEACPTLCRAFSIPDQVTADFVADFLRDVAETVAARGDRTVQDSDPALQHMLLRCY
ncbi:MAG: hypothetical protein ABEN55_05095, partial [Bradymonadaceae bacterium]